MARQRSAVRYTAWRRETCGAQPVAGKKPVRDSPTNPLHFLYPLPVTRWIKGRSCGKVCSFAWLLAARSLSSLISKYKDNSNMVSLTKKEKKLMQALQLFLRLKHFYSELTKASEPSDSISWFSSVIF